MSALPDIADIRQACLVTPGEAASLATRPHRDTGLYKHGKDAEASTNEDAEAIVALQDRLYAHRSNAVVLVLQGMDTSGKSSTIQAVFGKTGPQGVLVKSFGVPTPEERAHDFLWRVHNAVPPAGFIGVFDRSHYEDVLVVKVKGLAPPDVVEARYEQINAFEAHLAANGVTLVKCMLHISKESQREQLMERLELPQKRWKFNPADLDDRALWNEYQTAYETALTRCSTIAAPWYVVPADSRKRRKAIVARLVRGALEDIAPDWPDPGYRPKDFTID